MVPSPLALQASVDHRPRPLLPLTTDGGDGDCRECENYLEGEQKEMVELYVTKGMSNAVSHPPNPAIPNCA
jgi:hypothetical protein